MTSHTAFFGDAEYTFRFTRPLIVELEAKCGAGFGAIFQRVSLCQFKLSDISEIIRLALIGGGLDPKSAAELVAAYVADRPIAEGYAVAAEILRMTWFGPDKEEVK